MHIKIKSILGIILFCILAISTIYLIYNEKNIYYPSNQSLKSLKILEDFSLFLGSKFFILTIIFISVGFMLVMKKLFLKELISSIIFIIATYLLKIYFGRDAISQGGGFFKIEHAGLFPSGHVLSYLVMVNLFYMIIKDRILKRNIFKYIFFLSSIICLLLLSVYLVINNYHYISDISGSILLFLLFNFFFQRTYNYSQIKR